MNSIFSIENIAFSVFGSPVSWIELCGSVFGLVSVILAARANVWTWYTGLVSQIAYFAVFYQIQLYSDMLLQVFFTVLGFYGMLTWRKPKNNNQTAENTKIADTQTDLRIGYMPIKARIWGGVALIFTTIIWGFVMSKLPILLPQYFPSASSATYLDAAIAMMSVFATFYQTRKFVEFWWIYIVVDVLATGLYWYKGIPFTAVLYAIFLVMAIIGAREWQQKAAISCE
jgi:nicotinamide mononucleotide transporter